MEAPADAMESELLDWLLAGDPAIRWQVMRDLQGLSEKRWRTEQARVATEGWGARLFAHRGVDGRWTPRFYGRKWISTTYSMLLLRRLGVPGDDDRAQASCRLLLEEGLWHDGGINVTVTQPRSETCVTGMVLGLLSWFTIEDPRREELVDYVLREQLTDGGWNCERDLGATHSSFHTTINVLEGLRDYAEAGGRRRPETVEAEARGRDFLLVHHLYRSHRTGRTVDPRMLRLTYPPRWRYDVLRALDHFRAAGAPRDDRVREAIDRVKSKRGADGRWPLHAPHPGAQWFEMEQAGGPSRWNTLRALRVLSWWSDPD